MADWLESAFLAILVAALFAGILLAMLLIGAVFKIAWWAVEFFGLS